MDSHSAQMQANSILQPFLQAAGEAETQRELARLIHEHASAIIRGILQRKCGAVLPRPGSSRQSLAEEDAEDLYGEVVAELIARLYRCRASPREQPIHSFHDYVAVTAYHACDRHLRRKYPQRWSLQNRLRYLLSHQKGFALWQDKDGEWLAGFAEWRDRPPAPSATGRRCTSPGDAPALARIALAGGDSDRAGPADGVAALLNAAGRPITLDVLIATAAELWGIRDVTVREEVGTDAAPVRPREELPDPGADVSLAIDQRAYLERLWLEIRQLPPRQCAALLLHLQDARGRGVIALLPLRGIATVRQIAEALTMPAEQFAALWNELPLDDATLARHLGVSRQQVINLRKVARERLGRRMKAAGY